MSAIGVSLTQLITSAAFSAVGAKNVETVNDVLNEVTDYMNAGNMAFYDLDKIRASLKQTAAIQNLVKSVLDAMYGLSAAEYSASLCNSILGTFAKLSAQDGKLLSSTFHRVAQFSQDSDSVFSSVPGHSVLVYHADNLLISEAEPFFIKEISFTHGCSIFFEKFNELNNEPVLGDKHYGVLPFTITAATIESARSIQLDKLGWLAAFDQLSESIAAYWKDYNTPVNPDDRTDEEVATFQAVAQAHFMEISSRLVDTITVLILDFIKFAEG